MPGSSLWLLPPADDPLNAILATLIEKTSLHFNSPHRFLPHVTLTSNISPAKYGTDPQGWLEKLSLSSGGSVSVVFEGLASEDVFFRKLYIKCMKTDGIKNLATICRQEVNGFDNYEKANRWAKGEYNPHLSLMYHDCPKADAEALNEVNKLAQTFKLEVADKETGWTRGRVVLVPTDQPIDQWAPIAMRDIYD